MSPFVVATPRDRAKFVVVGDANLACGLHVHPSEILLCPPARGIPRIFRECSAALPCHRCLAHLEQVTKSCPVNLRFLALYSPLFNIKTLFWGGFNSQIFEALKKNRHFLSPALILFPIINLIRVDQSVCSGLSPEMLQKRWI